MEYTLLLSCFVLKSKTDSCMGRSEQEKRRAGIET